MEVMVLSTRGKQYDLHLFCPTISPAQLSQRHNLRGEVSLMIF